MNYRDSEGSRRLHAYVIDAATILDRTHCYSKINWTINRGNSISIPLARREKRWNVALRAAPRSKESERTVWVCKARGLIYARLRALRFRTKDDEERGRFRKETDVNGIGDKAALVSTIELMDDRPFPTFTPTLFPFVDFRFIPPPPSNVKSIILR